MTVAIALSGLRKAVGRTQALGVARAGRAEPLILDEPTAGLDPLMEAVFRDCIAEERRDGRTVLLSSHILGEVEALCDRVSIIRAGRTVESGTLAELRHLTRTRLEVELAAPLAALAEVPGVHEVTSEGLRMRCEVDPGELDEVLRRLAAAGVR